MAAKGTVKQTRTVEEPVVVEIPEIMKRITIFKDYLQWVVMIDISDVVPFEKFGVLDTLYSKMGLIVKRQFGYLGYYWGYGKMEITPQVNALPLVTAKVSINIYFPRQITDEWVVANAKKFNKIFSYIQSEYEMYYGEYKPENDD
jgi:hypothetical protein